MEIEIGTTVGIVEVNCEKMTYSSDKGTILCYNITNTSPTEQVVFHGAYVYFKILKR